MSTTAFEGERPRLRMVAARLLGGDAEADDVVQEAWVRLSRAGEVDDLPAWSTTVVTRLCLDRLRRRRTREAAEQESAARPRVSADHVLLAERVGDAVQVVLDVLAPAERAALVLHDVFGYSFDEVAAVLGRSPTAVRQLASRGRRKAQGVPEPAAVHAERAESRRVVEAFVAAARGGDLDVLLSLLAPDAVMRADLVAQSMGTPASYDGADAVAARFDGSRGAVAASIDGELGAAWFHQGAPKVVFAFHVDAGLIREIESIADPDVLGTLDVARIHGRTLDA